MDSFEKELERLINRYSKENESNTPDFILASYIELSLIAFNSSVKMRETWYGRLKASDLNPKYPKE